MQLLRRTGGLAFGAAPPDRHAGDCRRSGPRDQPLHLDALDKTDARILAQAAAQRRFDQEPAATDQPLVGGKLAQPVPAHPHLHIVRQIKGHGAGGDQVILDAGEQLPQKLQAAQQQNVVLPRLRCAWPQFRPLRQEVAIHQQHFVKMIGQHARRPQSRNAGAQDNRCARFGCVSHVPPVRDGVTR